MPIGNTTELYATEAAGELNSNYCKYCYADGAFTFNGTMEEMIEACLPHMLSSNKGMTEAEARKIMNDTFPHLKHWKHK